MLSLVTLLLLSCSVREEPVSTTGVSFRIQESIGLEMETKGEPYTALGGLPTDGSLSLGVVTYKYAASGTAESGKIQHHANVEATWNSRFNRWVPTHEISWPRTGGYLQFYAYAPYTTSISSGNGFNPVITYQVPADVSAQKGLLVSAPVEVPDNPAARGNSQDVALSFRHVLSGIRFTVGSGVKSVMLSGVYDKGRYDVDSGWGSFEQLSQTYTLTAAETATEILMMIPQTLPAGATVTITKSDNSTIVIPVGGHVLEQGKIIIWNVTADSPVSFSVSGSLPGDDFGLLAYTYNTSGADAASKTLYRGATRFTYNTSAGDWVSDSRISWPCEGHYIQFFAWSPYSAGTVTAASGSNPTLRYSSPASLGSQSGFVVARQERLDSPSLNEGLDAELSFEPTLAAIQFELDGAYTLRHIVLTGFYDSGTYDLQAGTWSDLAIQCSSYSITSTASVPMFPPQTLPAGATVTVNVEGMAPILIPVDGLVLEKGKIHTWYLNRL